MNSKFYNVLIADDSEVDRFLLKRAINSVAPQLRVIGEFDSGNGAIAYLSGEGIYADRDRHPFPDLLVLDSRMPGKGGIEVLEWLRTRDFSRLKVAFLADSSAPSLKPQALALGASFFFPKAVRSAELLHVARTLQTELQRGTGRKVLLRHRQTQAYYQGPGQWTPLIHKAMEFESFERAAHYGKDKKLDPDVEVMLVFTETGQSFAFPFPGKPATPGRQDNKT
jgi:DNA-binding NarL/FixJ family response regulator